MAQRIAVIAGDGVGPEVVAEGLKVLRASGAELDFDELPWGSEYHAATGAMMPPDALARLRGYDAIYLGAIGWPTVPDHVSLWECLLPIRKEFEQYVNYAGAPAAGDPHPAARSHARRRRHAVRAREH